MTGTERKRAWRLRNPEASREAERSRAQARRKGYWGVFEPGVAPHPCASAESYWRHECSLTRLMQRFWWRRCGAGGHRMTSIERNACFDELDRRETAALDGRQAARRHAHHSDVAMNCTRAAVDATL